MSWIKWFFGSWKIIEDFDIEYTLITKSGNEIITLKENIKPKKEIIGHYNDYDYFLKYKDVLKIYKNKLIKRAEEILNDYQKKERKKLKKVVLDSGDYIVKCDFEIGRINTKHLTYKEYKEKVLNKKC